jgi:hypothetical protein
LVKAQVMLAAKSTKKNHQLGRNHDMLGWSIFWGVSTIMFTIPWITLNMKSQ